MTMRNRSPQTDAEPTDAQDVPAPPARTPGVPAELLTELARRPDAEQLSSPLDIDSLLDMDIKGWRPEEGDKLIGTVVNVEVAGESTTFGAYPLLTIRRDQTGELVNVHAFHTVLRHELGKRQVGMGDRIGIKYLGLASVESALPYENYRVVVEPQGGARVSRTWATR